MMIQILILFLSAILSIFCIDKKYRNVFAKLVIVVLLVYLILLTGGSTKNADTEIYINMFEKSKYEFFSKDFGYGALLFLVHKMNWTYEIFRFVEYLIAFLLIHFGTRKLLKNYSPYFYLLYLLYPLLLDCVETRNFLAYSILIFALPFLLKGTKKGFLLFVILFICSASIHKIVLIYIPGLLLYFLLKTENKKTVVTLNVLFCLALGLGLFRKNISDFISSSSWFIFQIEGISRNLTIQNNNGWIVTYAYMICFVFSTNLCYSTIKQINLISENKNSIQYRFCKMVYILSMYAVMFAPFYAISEDFWRVGRNLYAFNIIAILIAFSECRRSQINTKKARLSLLFMLLVEFIGIAQIFYGNRQGDLIFDIFKNNIFF